MATTSQIDDDQGREARNARLRELARLSPDERIKRVVLLNEQLFRLRDDARASRARR